VSSRAHLGDLAAGLVDGALDHVTRERALAHLAHCPPCRAQVEAERQLKARLTAARKAPPPVPPDLAARLRALPGSAAGTPPLAVPPATPRRARRPLGAVRPGGRAPAARPVLRRRTAGGLLLAVGLAGAFALGSPSSGPDAPVDPASPAFVEAYVTATTEVPLTEPAFAGLVQPAGVSAGSRR
jgi:anti-sigma factor RsiW